MTKIKSGIIQMGLKGDTGMHPDQIRDLMLDAHLPLIDKAGAEGVQILCFQEVFTQPYFCPSQDSRWYAAAEAIPMAIPLSSCSNTPNVIIWLLWVPIYEEAMPGVYYNTAAVIDADGTYMGKYRKTHIPQVAGFWEKFFFKPGASNWPVFDTAYGKIGGLYLL